MVRTPIVMFLVSTDPGPIEPLIDSAGEPRSSILMSNGKVASSRSASPSSSDRARRVPRAWLLWPESPVACGVNEAFKARFLYRSSDGSDPPLSRSITDAFSNLTSRKVEADRVGFGGDQRTVE